MPDAFISYSVKDSDLARELHKQLTDLELDTFLAEISLTAGDQWKSTIIDSLNQSKWVFLLATPSSCKSTAVMHEIGAALSRKKELITLMCDISPNELPAWIQDRQAIDIKDRHKVITTLKAIAEQAKSDKLIGGLIIAGIVGLGIYAARKG